MVATSSGFGARLLAEAREIIKRVKDIAERRLAELLADEPPRDAAKLH
jgi:hypothetical protein